MIDVGDAFYPFDDSQFKRSVPVGRYTAVITGMEVSENMKFGKYVADVFKPQYLLDVGEHPEFEGCFVKDNGVFRYKKVEGHSYQHGKNWGFAKFLSIMQLLREEGKGGQLPYLHLTDIKNAKVLIDVFTKKFMNDLDSEIHYSVARVIQLVEKSPVPF
jgi:hypothetical protein|tara:strand:- start:5398 stop:5874 length:477 start_codon:yes stop_codon:yes gene_type:complete